MKDLDGALESLQEALKLDPTSSSTLVDLATVQLSQGKRAEAEAGFKQAVAVAPKSAQPRLALAGFYLSTNERAAAEAVLE
jgi:Flp pilus assembly protein TadD